MAVYLKNKDLLAEFNICIEKGETTRKFDQMIITLVENISTKYTYSDESLRCDMKQAAYLLMYTKWKKFNQGKGNNIFAYYTQIIRTAFAKEFNFFFLKNRVASKDVSFIPIDEYYKSLDREEENRKDIW